MLGLCYKNRNSHSDAFNFWGDELNGCLRSFPDLCFCIFCTVTFFFSFFNMMKHFFLVMILCIIFILSFVAVFLNVLVM